MKSFILLSIFTLLISCTLTSCGDECKMCRAEIGIGGVSASSPSQELCGDELKRAEKTPGMVCEKK